MNKANMVQRINELATGDFFLAERELPLSSIREAGGAALVDDSNSPGLVVAGVSFDDGDTAILQFIIPQDYAEGADKAAIRLVEVPSAAAADTTDLGILTAQIISRAGVAQISSNAGAKAEAATSSAGALVRENILDISDRGFKAGDVVQLILDGNNSSTTQIIVTGLALIYGSNLRAYNDDDAFRALGVDHL